MGRRSVHEFNWQCAFINLNINERISFLNKTILNIALNLTTNKMVICDDRQTCTFPLMEAIPFTGSYCFY